MGDLTDRITHENDKDPEDNFPPDVWEDKCPYCHRKLGNFTGQFEHGGFINETEYCQHCNRAFNRDSDGKLFEITVREE